MFRFMSRNLIFLIPNRSNHNAYAKSVRLLQTLTVESEQSNTCNSKNQHLPTVSYLTNKCGLSLHSAISASKKITITSTQNADSVLQLFKSYGFTQPQITNLITKYPSALLANPDESLEPKFEVFMSLGLSKPDLLTALFSDRRFYQTNFTKTIVPTVDFLKSILHTNDNVVHCIKNLPSIIYRNVRISMEPKVLTLRAHGAPDSNISKLLVSVPRTFLVRNDWFQESVRRVEEMGFLPESLAYLRAVGVLATVGELLWNKKIDIFKSFGWSDNDILLGFKNQQLFMTCSEKKIRIMMGFYLNKLSLKASDVAKYPNLLMFSLEKRIIPRCSVLQLLLSKGRIERDFNIVTALINKKTYFDYKFVTKYQEIIPEIVNVYQGEEGFPTFIDTQFASMIGFKNSQRVAIKQDH